MDPHRAHIILPTNATSAVNPLAVTTPTAIARDTVIQTNREGEPPEYREIKTTEKILQPAFLERAPPPDMTSATTTTTTYEEGTKVPVPVTKTTTTTTTVDEVPKVSVRGATTTTTVVEEVPTSTDYVVKQAASFKPVAVISDSTSINSANNRIVGTTASGSLTTPGKIVGDLEPVVTERHVTTVTEPVTKKITKTETIETIQ